MTNFWKFLRNEECGGFGKTLESSAVPTGQWVDSEPAGGVRIGDSYSLRTVT